MTDLDQSKSDSESRPDDKRFRNMWRQLFGDASVQVYFADSELNARVYTLDDESGYKVRHKKVGGAYPVEEPEDIVSQRLAFPKKARRGEKHGRAQLGPNDVAAIRTWAAEYASRKATPPWNAKAKELGVSEGTLRDIVARRTWSHLDEAAFQVNLADSALSGDHVPPPLAFPKKARRGEQHGRAQLGPEDVSAIRTWAAELISGKETPPWTAKAKELGVSEGTLRDIVARRTWSHLH